VQITFYGVRGSIPSPGLSTVKYGGNTSCVLAELNNGQRFILFHHDPDRTDAEELDEIQIENEIFFKQHYDNNRIFCAAEGMKITLSRQIAGGNTVIEVE
jgi:hypothetical protein